MNGVRTPTRPLGARDENRQQQPGAKRKEKPSSLCRTPPTLIRDRTGQSFRRGLCIGEGGFARCFQVNSGDGTLYAAKTIAKSTLSSEKTRTKLVGEIKIHRAMKHTNIVHYVDCFEDEANVYILLEMCANQSLMELVRRRKRLTETEARFFIVQILGAVNYMHKKLVIHRDLKLGNVFIDANMNMKIGDFGLAARLEHARQRRRTVCGTPNYIAPELLFRPHEHTYPTDIWAVGIIMFAMLFGKPPFQEKEVPVIYQRIKDHDLVFPADAAPVSSEAVDLIERMLNADPDARPSIEQVLAHPWFEGEFVASVPASAMRSVPVFGVSPEDSQLNFMTVKLASGLAMNAQTDSRPIEPVTAADVSTDGSQKVLPESLSPPDAKDKYHMVIVEEQRTAPTPSYDSPIVERTARRRAVVGVNRENQWPTAAVAARTSTEPAPAQLPAGPAPAAASTVRAARPRPLSAFVSTMANGAAQAAAVAASYAMRGTPAPNTAPGSGSSSGTASRSNSDGSTSRRASAGAIHRTASRGAAPPQPAPPAAAASSQMQRPPSRPPSRAASSAGRPESRPEVREAHLPLRQAARETHDKLLRVIYAYNNRELFAGPKTRLARPTHLTKWADFNDVWGLAYGLNDGTIGMRFRDHTSMRMDPRHGTFTYYEPTGSSDMAVRRLGTRGRPTDHKKIEVLQFAHKYMTERLGHTDARHASRTENSDGVFVVSFVRAKTYIMFTLSDGTLQFNFQDHHKLVLFNMGEHVHLITADRQEHTLTLAETVLAADTLPHVAIKNKLEEIVMALSGQS